MKTGLTIRAFCIASFWKSSGISCGIQFTNMTTPMSSKMQEFLDNVLLMYVKRLSRLIYVCIKVLLSIFRIYIVHL
jgi:hypothetical protein